MLQNAILVRLRKSADEIIVALKSQKQAGRLSVRTQACKPQGDLAVLAKPLQSQKLAQPGSGQKTIWDQVRRAARHLQLVSAATEKAPGKK
jgi:BarA-like signal transduction histidine kinase